MNVLWFKLISLLIIFIVGVSVGIIPLKRHLSSQDKRILTLGNAFSGGVFLGAGLLHMLPDAIKNFKTVAGNYDYPIPAMLAGIGFILIMFMDKGASGRLAIHDTTNKKNMSFPIVLYIVLSIHSIIAGTSLGLEGGFLSATAIFIAIIAHKGAAAFSLGVNLKKKAFVSKRYIVTIAFFAMMTPLGVILGTFFSHILSDRSGILFEMIFDSLATGTFLYIAIAEIMGDVFEQKKDTWGKLALISIGFAIMAMIAIWV